jgi:hypothetical protein
MSARDVTDELVERVARDLRDRYSLDEEAVRALGARLANPNNSRAVENLLFAERFVTEHRETFERLGQ